MLKKLKQFFTKRGFPFEINYIYFSFAFLFLTLLSAFHIFSKENSLIGTNIYFLLHAIGQAFLEVTCFVLLASWIKRALPNWIYKLFIGLTFLFLLVHFMDFILVRLMDSSIIYAFKLFFAEGITHFFAALAAMNMNHSVLILIMGVLIAIPLVGILFYWLTKKIIRKKPFKIYQSHLFTILIAIALTLSALNIGAKPFLNAKTYNKYQTSLPFGTTFMAPKGQKINLSKPLQAPHTEQNILKTIQSKSFVAQEKPNIYLFVVETFRSDHINNEIAPNLSQFKEENISYPLALSNANATHLSWFSIFHSDFPFHWTEKKKTTKTGSIPIQILKKMGYRTHVISSAELSYYKMNELLFGQNESLIDDYKEIPTTWDKDSSDRDVESLKKLQEDLTKEYSNEGNLFIVFLDSTHSEYNWPKDYPTKFSPIVEKIDYLALTGSKKDLEAIKNRYKNSVSFVDHLFGNFVNFLKQKNLYQNSIIVVTGDHGEEFFENGALFHGTHLNNSQTMVPLFYKFPTNKKSLGNFTSQMDIFPSIIHYLSNQSDFSNLFSGESIFSERKWPYILSMKQNGGATPNEFYIHDGKNKILAKIQGDIYQTKEIEVQDIQNLNEDSVSDPSLISKFQNALNKISDK